jgi:hypothetical protein
VAVAAVAMAPPRSMLRRFMATSYPL